MSPSLLRLLSVAGSSTECYFPPPPSSLNIRSDRISLFMKIALHGVMAITGVVISFQLFKFPLLDTLASGRTNKEQRLLYMPLPFAPCASLLGQGTHSSSPVRAPPASSLPFSVTSSPDGLTVRR